jgi:putative transposase
MKSGRSPYSGYRSPPEIISYAVWAYHRFCLRFRDVEVLLAERGIIVSYETIRQWCEIFGPDYARKSKRREGRLGDHWHLVRSSFELTANSGIYGVPSIRMVT